ncbi:MAG: hypothetical protein ABJE95_31075 [Byssovorax sp.]
MRSSRSDGRARRSHAAIAIALGLVLFGRALPARADDAPAAPAPAIAEAPAPAESAPTLRDLSAAPSAYAHLVGTLQLGKGLRFNNPYRLATQLGATAESVSLTSTYLDLGGAIAFGPPNGLEHGVALHLSFALGGVAQAVLTPTYFAAYRGPHRFLAYGRLGPAIVLTPDPTIGGELAAGFGWFFTARLAVAGELVGDLFYGAGTPTNGITTYPIFSGQLGLLVDYEILP